MGISPVTLVDLTGGLNLRASLSTMAANESPFMHNIDIIPSGGIRKSKGYRTLNRQPLGVPISGMHSFVPSIHNECTNEVQLLVSAGTKLYILNYQGVWFEVYNGLVDGANVFMATIADQVLIMNGKQLPLVWDGKGIRQFDEWNTITFTDTLGFPSMAKEWKSRVFFAGDSLNPSTLFATAPGTFNDFDTDNGAFGLAVDPGDGRDITAMVPFYDILAIHKYGQSNGSINFLAGSTAPGSEAGDEYNLRKFLHNIATDNNRGIINFENDQLFFTGRTIRTISPTQKFGDAQTDTVSYKVEPLVENRTPVNHDKSFAIFYPRKNQTWFFFNGSGGVKNDTVLIYWNETKAFTQRTGFTGSAGCLDADGNLLIGDYEGNVHRHDFGESYNGKAIDAEFRTPYMTFGDPVRNKQIRSMDFLLSRLGLFDVKIELAWDYLEPSVEFRVPQTPEAGAGVWNIDNWDEANWYGSDFIAHRNHLSGLGSGKACQVRIINRNADEPFRLSGLTLLARVRSPRLVARLNNPRRKFYLSCHEALTGNDEDGNFLLFTEDDVQLITEDCDEVPVRERSIEPPQSPGFGTPITGDACPILNVDYVPPPSYPPSLPPLSSFEQDIINAGGFVPRLFPASLTGGSGESPYALGDWNVTPSNAGYNNLLTPTAAGTGGFDGLGSPYVEWDENNPSTPANVKFPKGSKVTQCTPSDAEEAFIFFALDPLDAVIAKDLNYGCGLGGHTVEFRYHDQFGAFPPRASVYINNVYQGTGVPVNYNQAGASAHGWIRMKKNGSNIDITVFWDSGLPLHSQSTRNFTRAYSATQVCPLNGTFAVTSGGALPDSQYKDSPFFPVYSQEPFSDPAGIIDAGKNYVLDVLAT